ncbi:hypothetical protein C5167_038198 [Papaver somniferum]|uniref:Uncharacterized protein n=1 Tax=Papaver somniferum TaxID=3469 RepID=A0A4Y7IB40_PAPSO|nr:uncharacterized protein LOC113347373 [Papaver somniferum]RZC45256.1 hypothetical protein C5167_038198 [Papaver somniferum]
MASRNGEQPAFSVFSQNLVPLRFFLQSNDGHVIEIEESLGMQFDALKRLVQGGQITLTYDCRRVVALNSSRFILDIVIQYTRNYAQLQDRIKRIGCGYVTLIRARNERDLDFIKWVTDKRTFGLDKPQSVQMLREVAAAAGDLGMQRLLDVSCGALSMLIQDYTEEDIYALLGVRIKKTGHKIEADTIAEHIGHARDLQRMSYGSHPNYMRGATHSATPLMPHMGTNGLQSQPNHMGGVAHPQMGTNSLQNPGGAYYWVGDQGVAMEGVNLQRRIPENGTKNVNVSKTPEYVSNVNQLSLTFGQLNLGREGDPLFTDMEMPRMIS